MFDKLIGESKGEFNTITIVELLVSLLFVVIGITNIANSSTNTNSIAFLCSFLLVVAGGFSIFSYYKRGPIVLYNNNLIYGVLLILFGILSLILKNVLLIIVGIFLIISGIQKVNYGFFLKKFNESSWFITSVFGLLLIVIAVVSFFNNTEFLTRSISLCFLAYGLLNITILILLRHRSKYFIG